MKASELIEELKRKIEDFGDCDVVAATDWNTYIDDETGEREWTPANSSVQRIDVHSRRMGGMGGDEMRFMILQ